MKKNVIKNLINMCICGDFITTISYSKILPEPDKNVYSCLPIIILFLFVYEILYFQSVLPSRSEHTKKDKIRIYVMEKISFINYLIYFIRK